MALFRIVDKDGRPLINQYGKPATIWDLHFSAWWFIKWFIILYVALTVWDWL